MQEGMETLETKSEPLSRRGLSILKIKQSCRLTRKLFSERT